MYQLADRKGLTLSQAFALPGWEIVEWQAFYEVQDWIRQGLGKEHNYKRGLEFARAVQSLEEEAHLRKKIF